ncbi:HD domain-containing protein [Dehalobacter sp. DCM]|uniref:CCA tRNA nucleotidyltransferase n=1 Tax=Dehalobacter sp. DCM TaxID=2907827 RepID=UPI0030821D55|nr:HD domain-containing protein [Dehalobacter sp. DCM]
MLINPKAKRIIEILEFSGYEAFIVGGCVRDLILGVMPKDWDITTNALPEQMLTVFKDYHTIPTGLKHGTITVMLDHEPFEVTTYRIDGEYSDNRRPDTIKYSSSLIEDLARRDFTMNAIAYNPKTGIVDPFCGQEAIRANVINTVGNADERFREDALRMLRCIRFACQLGATIDGVVYDSLCRNRERIQWISMERIREETNKILISDFPSRGISLLYKTGLLRYFLPEICSLADFDQHNPHHHKDVLEHTMLVLDAVPNTLSLRWAALMHDIGKPAAFSLGEDGIGHFYEHHKLGADMARDILLRLKFDHDTVKKVGILVYNHMYRYDTLRTASIKRFITRVGVDNLDDLFALQLADVQGSKPPHDFSKIIRQRKEVERILNQKEPLALKDLKVNGNDLRMIGFEPGKRLGDTLRYLMEEVLQNPELNNKNILLGMADTIRNSNSVTANLKRKDT